jgi:hypothetical protein
MNERGEGQPMRDERNQSGEASEYDLVTQQQQQPPPQEQPPGQRQQQQQPPPQEQPPGQQQQQPPPQGQPPAQQQQQPPPQGQPPAQQQQQPPPQGQPPAQQQPPPPQGQPPAQQQPVEQHPPAEQQHGHSGHEEHGGHGQSAAEVAQGERPGESAVASTPLLQPEDAKAFERRWEDVQVSFVDQPRSALQEADDLVDEVMKRISQRFADERSGLEGQWAQGGEASTEDMRVALQHYRSFFNRLLKVQEGR